MVGNIIWDLWLKTLPALPERTTRGEHRRVVDTLGTLFNLRMSLPRLQFIPNMFTFRKTSEHSMVAGGSAQRSQWKLLSLL